MRAATWHVEANTRRASQGLRTPRLGTRQLDVVPDGSSPCSRSSLAAAPSSRTRSVNAALCSGANPKPTEPADCCFRSHAEMIPARNLTVYRTGAPVAAKIILERATLGMSGWMCCFRAESARRARPPTPEVEPGVEDRVPRIALVGATTGAHTALRANVRPNLLRRRHRWSPGSPAISRVPVSW
jgi:hypothetical protein